MTDQSIPNCSRENCERDVVMWCETSGFALCQRHIRQRVFLEALKEWQKESLKCSFCGKPAGEVLKLIAGPKVYICNECVDLCNEIMDEEKEEEASGGGVEILDQSPKNSTGKG